MKITPVELEDFDPQAPCVHALEFIAWSNELVRQYNAQGTIQALILAKKELSDQYWAYYGAVTAKHRYNVKNNSHQCIFHVYQDYYNMFTIYELRILNSPLEVPKEKRPKEATYLESLLEQARREDDGDEEA